MERYIDLEGKEIEMPLFGLPSPYDDWPVLEARKEGGDLILMLGSPLPNPTSVPYKCPSCGAEGIVFLYLPIPDGYELRHHCGAVVPVADLPVVVG